ncbi:MAG: HIT family protein [archaeon]
MIDCKICEFINNKENIIYEDELVYAMIPEKPLTLGHIWVVPKKHYPIIEQVPDFEIAPLFRIANKLSSILFETLKIQGTNIIVQNGIAAGQQYAHFIVNIIPRRENDGLKLEWTPKQISEEEMSTAELKLKEQSRNVGDFIKETPKETIALGHKKEILDYSDEENYLIRQLHRIP